MSPRSHLDPRERGNPACEKMQRRQNLSVSRDKNPFYSEFQGLLGRNCSGVTIPINSGLRVSGKKDWYFTHFLNVARYVARGDKFTAGKHCQLAVPRPFTAGFLL